MIWNLYKNKDPASKTCKHGLNISKKILNILYENKVALRIY